MKRLLEGPLDRLNRDITDGFSTREKKLYQDYMTVRLKLANLEDDVMSMYAPDWFRCEGCDCVMHHEHLGAHCIDSNDPRVCAYCGPEEE